MADAPQTAVFDTTTATLWGLALALSLGCGPCLFDDEPRPPRIFDDEVPDPEPSFDPATPAPPEIRIEGGETVTGDRVFYGSELPIEVGFTPCEGSLVLRDGDEALATIATLDTDAGVVIFDLSTADDARLTSLDLSVLHTCQGDSAESPRTVFVQLVGVETIVPAFEADFRTEGGELVAIEGDAIHRVSTRSGKVEPVASGSLEGLQAPIRLQSTASGGLYATGADGAFVALDGDLQPTWSGPEGILLRHPAILEADAVGVGERVFALGIDPETGLVSAAEFDTATGAPIVSAPLPGLPIAVPTALTPDGRHLKIGQIRLGAVRAQLVEQVVELGAEGGPTVTESTIIDIELGPDGLRNAFEGRYTRDAALLVLSLGASGDAPQLVLVDRDAPSEPLTFDLDAPLVAWDELDDEHLWIATERSVITMTRSGEVVDGRDVSASGVVALMEADPAALAGFAAVSDTHWVWLRKDLSTQLGLPVALPLGGFDLFWEETRAPVLLVPGASTLPPQEGPALIRLAL